MVSSKKVALTVDLEEWTVPKDFGTQPVAEDVRIDIARVGLKRILQILKIEGVIATFFVTGYFAQRNQGILRDMVEAGHEISNHSLEHVRKPRRTWKEEVEEINESARIIEDSAGIRPRGYREPYLAITERKIITLLQAGYLYDSSIMGTWLPNKSQWVKFPSQPFEWETPNSPQNLVELPLSVFTKLRIPIGWWLFRKNFGESLPIAAANVLFKLDQPFITNLHTWELTDPPQGYKIPPLIRFNCGERSTKQIHRLIVRLKQLGGEFVLMRTLAQSIWRQPLPQTRAIRIGVE